MTGPVQPFQLPIGPPALPDDWESDFTPPTEAAVGRRGLVPALEQLAAGRTADEFGLRADGDVHELPQLQPREIYAVAVAGLNAQRVTFGAVVSMDGQTAVTADRLGTGLQLPAGRWRVSAHLLAETQGAFECFNWVNAADDQQFPIQAPGCTVQGQTGGDGAGAPAVAIVDGPVVARLHMQRGNVTELYLAGSGVLVEKVIEHAAIDPGDAPQGTLQTPADNQWVSSQDLADAIGVPDWYTVEFGTVQIPANDTGRVAFGIGATRPGKWQVWLHTPDAPETYVYHEFNIDLVAGGSFYLGMPATSQHQAPQLISVESSRINDNVDGVPDSIYLISNVDAALTHQWGSASASAWTLHWRHEVGV